jgi:hypothetical protein
MPGRGPNRENLGPKKQKTHRPVLLVVGSYCAGLRKRFCYLNHPTPESACPPHRQQQQVDASRLKRLFILKVYTMRDASSDAKSK